MIRAPAGAAAPFDLRVGLAAALAVPIAALLLAGCVSAPPAADAVPPSAPAEPLYAAVIDAGSSASRIHLFAWRPAPPGEIPWLRPAPWPPEPGAEPWEARSKPGLGELADDPEAVAAALQPLVDFAAQKLGGDPERLARYPLFLKATGGLRLLEPAARDRLLGAARDFLATTPFRVAGVEVIGGDEEGVFGWLSVNYLLGYLDDGGPFPSAGALDLGGASTQITFAPLDLPREDGFRVEVGPSVFPLYTRSYLGLGQDEAREAHATPACFPRGLELEGGGVGTGDYAGCREALRRALARPCGEDPCSLMGVYQPPVHGDFFALSAYTYAARFFGLGEVFSPAELERGGREFCALDWATVRERYADQLDNPYLGRHCFTAAFLVTLLTEGFGFPADTRRILVPDRIQGHEPSWTLGALLYELTR